ncbi:hypothetical protein CDD81_932 [Ophiocordyceps australis]|uniref:Phospholipase/carboxylesterase/thioesterase domain-containing protein n=1 Tax=Ophiocordyceps australis TaxID=1399860 RepID=A0A2C5YG75_9HYPO|nr:hypothetical protein CDD81_932 [Ophiocordyceps australis]
MNASDCPIVVPPLAPHKLTVICLHGRGSCANKFYEPFLSCPLSDGRTFGQALHDAKLIFPTAPRTRVSKYRRCSIRQWYDGTGDWEPEARGGMRASVEHIHALLLQEMALLDNNGRAVVLVGFSQGCAMALISLLLWHGQPLGGFVGLCGFMPLNTVLMQILHHESQHDADDIVFEDTDGHDVDSSADADAQMHHATPLVEAIGELRQEAQLPGHAPPPSMSFVSVPVYLGHGAADDKVDLRYGRGAAALLEKMGLMVEFHVYQGQGHCYSTEMLDHVIQFLAKIYGGVP